MRAQSSVEVIIILTGLMLVLGIMLDAGGIRLSDTRTYADAEIARAGINGIASAADEVYSEGAGSERLVQLVLPATVVKGASFVDGNLLGVQIRGPRGPMDINAQSSAPLQGSLPDVAGEHTVRVRAVQGAVVIGKTSLSVEPTIVYAYMGKLGAAEGKITFTNTGAEPLTVSLALDWQNPGAGALLSTNSISLAPGESRTVDISFWSSEAPGTYAGSLEVDASNGEQFNLRVMADVLA
ncbi:MAG: hypothetical protein Q7T16_01555 [Candidatus Burarchaeum sp.]|nr:hypothetical protein [Candidatus Burarchaeum sp.]MDO8339322.1 hypothetical protein [Candidatus Burarchaeum sp.]